MDEEEINQQKKSIEIGDNLDDLSIDELENYIDLLKQEIERVKNIKYEKSKALELAKDYFKQ